MILLSKTKEGQIQELEKQLDIELKKQQLHTKLAYEKREHILYNAGENQTALLGQFADHVRFADRAQRSVYNLNDQLKML